MPAPPPALSVVVMTSAWGSAERLLSPNESCQSGGSMPLTMALPGAGVRRATQEAKSSAQGSNEQDSR